MSTAPQSLELGREYPLPGEADDIRRIADISERQLRDKYSKDSQAIARRDQHPKNHGVIWAEFMIESDIHPSHQVGVFKEPGKVFPAWIRYSNGQAMDDSDGGSHGMAVKLMDVHGPKALGGDAQTQDFVMIDHPVFFIRSIPDYIQVFERMEAVNIPPDGKKGSPIKALVPFFFPNPLPWSWRARELKEFLTLGGIKKIFKPNSPLNSDYFSVTPYLLGEGQAIKFLVKPFETNKPTGKVNKKSPDHLRQAMKETLGDRDTGFEFFIQVQSNPVTMPVEDSTIYWDADPIKVATIRIPKQSFDSPEQMKFCENLSYTPWHALAEQRPLGSMNRARKEVYQHTAAVRRDINGVEPKTEPTVDSFHPKLL